MSRKLTLEDCQKKAESRGGRCLSTEYVGVRTEMEWECEEGHVWKTNFASIKYYDSWCIFCAGVVKHTLEDCQEWAENKGGMCLSTKYVSKEVKMDWQCSEGHTWKARFGDVKNKGSWCSKCKGIAKLSLVDCQELAKSKGGKCLSTEYVNNRVLMEWECEEGHKWPASFGNIKNNNTWCPFCSGKLGTDIETCREIAKERGGQCLSTKYIDNKDKLMWSCKENHTWLASLKNIKINNTWCPFCSGRMKLTLEDCQKLAKSRDGKCLSTEYVNVETKMKWRCNKGHMWEATFGGIKHDNTWCPKCRIRKTQNKLINIVQNLFPEQEMIVNCRSLDWLKNPETGQNLEIDIWIPELKLAIEYDGEQHFMPVNFGGMSDKRALESFERIKKRDRCKNKLIKKHSELVICFIRFRYDEPIEEKYVVEKIKSRLNDSSGAKVRRQTTKEKQNEYCKNWPG